MSKKQWIVLLMLFLAYLLLGASIFYHIEGQLELEHVELAKQERIRIHALLHEHYVPSQSHSQHEILERLTEYCGKSVYNYTEGESDPLKWDFYNSFYFAYTVVSTIGYGNLAPTNMLSRILMIFYGLVGIPMNGILLSQLGEFFGHVFVRAHRKYKSYKKHRDDYYPKKLTPLETRKAGLAAQIFMYLTPGFVMFIFFPAFLFSHYEGWSYDEAVYYAFVTLTTIGFGDYVAGQDNTKGSGFFFILYKTFLICWISFGLGYIVMIMTFIAQGMRSKKIIRIEHKLAMNLKHTQSKIWNEFNKEINYLRRVFNELQLSKVKRVYVDEFSDEIPPTKFSRSNSFPDLRKLNYGGLEIPTPLHPRRRANSEVVPMEPLIRVVSETDLQRIDKTATFAAHAIVQPAELLAKLVNILGYIPPPEDVNDSSDWEQEHKDEEETRRVVGVDGFSEKDILAKENGASSWIIGNDKIPSFTRPRSRAASEVRLYETKNEANIHQENGEWTWSDPAASKKIQELIKTRRTGLSTVKDSKLSSYKFPSISLPKSVPKNLFPPWRRQSKAPDVEQGNQKSTQIDSDFVVEPNYSSLTSKMEHFGNLDDEIDNRRSYFTHTGATEGSNILEETSVADFLRAITVLHAKIGTVPTEYVQKPQRKMGTACLTPPRLPSLFTLFSQPSGDQGYSQSNQSTISGAQSSQYGRRFSLRPNENQSGFSTPSYRRGSSIPSTKARRFSLRPVTTLNGIPSEHSATHTSSRLRDDQTKLPFLADSFLVESQKKPLVEMEGTPGVSSPVATSSNIRRFSLKSAQTGVPTAPQSMQTPKPVPRWKAGMLQRQIGRMSVRRRVRAFSLGDVQTDKSEKMSNLSPLATDGSVKTISAGRPSIQGQKTVTIVPPTKENEVLQTASAGSSFPGTTESTDNQNLLKGFKNIPPYNKFAFRSESLQEKSSCSDDQAKLLEEIPVNTNPFITSTTSNQDNLKDISSSKIEGNFELYQDQCGDKGEKKEISEFFSDITKTKRESGKSTELNLTSNTQQLEPDIVPIEIKAATEEGETKRIYSEEQKQSNVTNENSIKSTKGDENMFPMSTLMSVQSSADVVKDGKLSTTSQSSSRKSLTIKSEDKPRVSIDSYKLDLKIEKPSVNPFLQYQASTSAPLAEVKIEKPGEMVVHRKLSAEAKKPWEKG